MTKFGKLFFTLVVLGLVTFAIVNWWPKMNPIKGDSSDAGHGTVATALIDGIEFVAAPMRPASLPEAQTYQMHDQTITIELSEYAGYAGLIIANGGLAANESSFFFKNYGFKVQLTTSEEDSWPALQRGELAASSTTVDVLACYGRPFQVVVPAQICFSRGADGIIVRKDIKRINHLKGKVIACAPFNETEFFIRYLAQEANLPIHRLGGLDEKPNTQAINLVFCEDAMIAGDAFVQDLESGTNLLAGCVTWAPKTTEIVAGSQGEARQLVNNQNLLVISDILMFNKGFAEAHPDIVKGVVHGLLYGNDLVRNSPDTYARTLATAFSAFEWTEEDAKEELSKVHLSNLPENLAFFSGAIDAAGSFESIYQSSTLAYGSEIIPNPVAAEHFISLAALESLKDVAPFATQEIAIKPIRSSTRSPVEADPLLTKDIRFLFEPNSSKLDREKPINTQYLSTIQKLLQVSPGSMVLLRGHVDDAKVEEFRKQGGEAMVRNLALKAMELSKNRAQDVRQHLVDEFKISGERIEIIGRGWEEPSGKDSEQNRRVEVQWFTLE